jgi:hypothetical protein
MPSSNSVKTRNCGAKGARSQNSGFRINKEHSYPFWILTSGFWILVCHEGSDVTYLNKCFYKATRV